jgi:DmsE family decaheme c-type cytochrome
MSRSTVVLAALLVSASAASVLADNAPSRADQYTTTGRYTQISGATRIGAGECRACHDGEARMHVATAHRDVECEDCHGPGSLHANGQGDRTKILGFSSRPAEDANGVCLECHASRSELHQWRAGAHGLHLVRCAECHREHVEAVKLDARSARNEACLRCHRKQQAEGALPYHHPVRENRMGCTDCHDPHGGPTGSGLKADDLNDLCFQCHAEFQGPFTYQHPPVTENCATCHTVHGSMQRALLKVSQPMLCLQCHPGHHNGSGVPLLNSCTNCHSSIHGSDVPSATGGSVFIDKH